MKKNLTLQCRRPIRCEQLNARLCLAKMHDSSVWLSVYDDHRTIRTFDPSDTPTRLANQQCSMLPEGCSRDDAFTLLQRDGTVLLTVAQARKLFHIRLAEFRSARSA